MYSKNSNSKRLPWPSRRRDGLRPFDRSNTSSLSTASNMFRNKIPVMVPLSEQQQKQGMFLPLNMHSGPRGNAFPSPMFFSISVLFSDPLYKWIEASFPFDLYRFSSKNNSAHEWLSVSGHESQYSKMGILVAALCCGRPSLVHRYVCPPT
jgi:hypothetical protein